MGNQIFPNQLAFQGTGPTTQQQDQTFRVLRDRLAFTNYQQSEDELRHCLGR
jgi:hypothetical protein